MQLFHIFLTKDKILKLFEKTEEIVKWPTSIIPGKVALVRVAWPLNHPNWDYNTAFHWDKYSWAKENLLEALQEIGQKPLNWSEFQHTVQWEGETPDAFWVHLLEVGIAYAHLDISNPKDQ